jgi:thiol-disulfide isomerase/thioredoxin
MEPAPSPAPLSPGRRILAAWRAARRRWYTRWPIDLAILMFIFWAIGRWQARNLLDDETVAPAIALPDLDGRLRTLDEWRGKTVSLQFFAPWCTVCRVEMDNWARIQSMNSDIQVVAVALAWENRQDVLDFIGDDRGQYPVLLGTDQVQAAWRVESFPTHYILDEDGRIASQTVGYSPTLAMWLRSL